MRFWDLIWYIYIYYDKLNLSVHCAVVLNVYSDLLSLHNWTLKNTGTASLPHFLKFPVSAKPESIELWLRQDNDSLKTKFHTTSLIELSPTCLFSVKWPWPIRSRFLYSSFLSVCVYSLEDLMGLSAFSLKKHSEMRFKPPQSHL